MPDHLRLRRTVLPSVGFGLLVGLLYSMFAGLVRIVSGEGPFRNLGVNYSTVVLGYFIAGFLGGLLAGVAPVLLRTRLGRSFLATVAVYPIATIVCFARPESFVTDMGVPRDRIWLAAALLALFISMIIGTVLGFTVAPPSSRSQNN
jgi:hypothetical protein